MIKTVLAPNAPWPYNGPMASQVQIKVRRVRSKPENTDAKFEAWLKSITPVKRKP